MRLVRIVVAGLAILGGLFILKLGLRIDRAYAGWQGTSLHMLFILLGVAMVVAAFSPKTRPTEP
ncbi:MAG: hypothetical protein AABY18_07465 [Candidatus Thermoplasmatota archaeon]